jgi:hypothetical protein
MYLRLSTFFSFRLQMAGVPVRNLQDWLKVFVSGQSMASSITRATGSEYNDRGCFIFKCLPVDILREIEHILCQRVFRAYN